MNQPDRLASRLETLPISATNREIALANLAAANASVERIARAVTWAGSLIASINARMHHRVDVDHRYHSTQ